MSKILIVGSGAFGTALSNVLMANHHEVHIYSIDENQINDLKNGINTKFFGDLKLDSIPQLITNNFQEAVVGVEYLILAIPSKNIESFLKEYKNNINENIIIINASKGIQNETKQNYFEVINKYLIHNHIVSIAGPTFAIDLLLKKYSVANITGKNQQIVNNVINLFKTNYFKLQPCYDEEGVSVYSALKNVIAIGSGFLFGMEYSINTIAAYVNLGLQEINRYVLMKNGNENTIFSFAAIGDTFLTCFSHQSRNYSLGYDLATKDINEVLNKNITIEGFNTINAIYDEIKDKKEFNILNLIYHLVNQNIDKDKFIELIWANI